MRYEIKKIDAINTTKEGWKWDASYKIGEFKTNATDEKRAFLYALHKLGIVCQRGKMTIICNGDTYELQNRRTEEPFFAAVPIH